MKVHSTFLTAQGTGHLTGLEQFFVRTAGCSITTCPLRRVCDEPEALTIRNADDVEPEALADAALAAVGPGGWLHITGGEPMDQADEVGRLTTEARDRGLFVHMQTSGLRPVDFAFDWLTVSPKGELAQTFGQELVVVYRGQRADELAALMSDTSFFYYYLQPEWGQSADSVLRMIRHMNTSHRSPHHNGRRWMLGIQAHKHLGIE